MAEIVRELRTALFCLAQALTESQLAHLRSPAVCLSGLCSHSEVGFVLVCLALGQFTRLQPSQNRTKKKKQIGL